MVLNGLLFMIFETVKVTLPLDDEPIYVFYGTKRARAMV
jgi:hypothetical protein